MFHVTTIFHPTLAAITSENGLGEKRFPLAPRSTPEKYDSYY